MSRAIIIMGSDKDLEHVKAIAEKLGEFGIPSYRHAASAHKAPNLVKEILAMYDTQGEPTVYITVAGRSDALSAFVDFHSRYPVLACPPLPKPEDPLPAYMISTVDVPSGIGAGFFKYPESVAIAAAKILGMQDERIARNLDEYKSRMRIALEKTDVEVSKPA